MLDDNDDWRQPVGETRDERRARLILARVGPEARRVGRDLAEPLRADVRGCVAMPGTRQPAATRFPRSCWTGPPGVRTRESDRRVFSRRLAKNVEPVMNLVGLEDGS